MQKFVIETKTGNIVELDMSIFEVDKEKGMVNLTKIAKTCERELSDWLRADKTRELISAMDDELTPNGGSCIVAENGNCTWGSREIALDLAMWVSPRFKVWCIKALDELFQTGKVELKPKDYWRQIQTADREIRLLKKSLKLAPMSRAEIASAVNSIYDSYGIAQHNRDPYYEDDSDSVVRKMLLETLIPYRFGGVKTIAYALSQKESCNWLSNAGIFTFKDGSIGFSYGFSFAEAMRPILVKCKNVREVSSPEFYFGVGLKLNIELPSVEW
jgi:hypothetical protein